MPGVVTRRDFLRGTAAAAGLVAVPGFVSPVRAAILGGPGGAFAHGVASGDPLPDAVILWTRVTATGPVTVRWEIAEDEAMSRGRRVGTVRTDDSRDWTVKVDAGSLRPGTTYYYRFAALGQMSPVGRTRTASVGDVRSARFAVVTCGDFTRGYFHAYGHVADVDDLDAVIHLGDYIYEGDHQNRVRPHFPARECRTVDDYRARYASYRLDPDLAAMHRRHPFIWVWDDHETCDGTWRNGADPSNHDPEEDGPFAVRKAAALQAALEWLPIRTPDPAVPERIYRRFQWGGLVDLFMLDTRRIGRDEQVTGNTSLGGDFFRQDQRSLAPHRQVLGAAQEDWLRAGLGSSTAAWRLLGNQVVFSPIKVFGAPNSTGQSVYANPDQWDGYPVAQQRLFDMLRPDTVVLTGDVHASMAYEVALDTNNPAAYEPVTGTGARAVEFVTPSVSSAGDPKNPDIPGPSADDFEEFGEDVRDRLLMEGGEALRIPNPHLKYSNARYNGFMLLHANAERVEATYRLLPYVTMPVRPAAFTDRTFTVARGHARLR
jgi:alkaline phosphatase D